MLYFSDIFKKKVYTEEGTYLGRFRDFLFLASENPKVTKIRVRTPQKQKIYLSIDEIKKINKKMIVKNNFRVIEPSNNELSLLKHLLDQQIIDMKGSKVVRVNDVIIQTKPYLKIEGVDIGFLGILRWFNLDKIIRIFNLKISPIFLGWHDIQPLELSRGTVQLNKEKGRLEKIRPEDLADYLEKTTIANVDKIIGLLDEEYAADVIESLNLSYQTGLFKYFSSEKAARVLNIIDPDEAVDILLALTYSRQEKILKHLEVKKQSELKNLLNLSNTNIGELIIPDFLTVSAEETVKKCYELLKKETSDFSFLHYIYVVNKQKQLIGIFNLHELALQEHMTPVYRFMIQNVVTIHLTTPRKIAYKKMVKYKVHSLPVIDSEKKILGVVAFSDIAEAEEGEESS